MLKHPITVLVQATVGGPGGKKLKPGQVVELEDSPYVRVMVKSGTVALLDPASLDDEYLEKAGYELREGYSYPEKTKDPVVDEAETEKPKAEKTEITATRPPKRMKKVSPTVEPAKEEDSESGVTDMAVVENVYNAPEITGIGYDNDWYNHQEKDN